MDKKSRAYLYVVSFVSVFLGLCGFAFLFVAASMQSRGLTPNPLIILLGFFACEIIAIIILICNLKHFIVYDFDKKILKYDSASFTVLENASQEHIYDTFAKENFKDSQCGYLRRKVFSFFKDSICYYVRIVDFQNIETAIETEFELFYSINETSKNICFILFAYKENLAGEDFEALKAYSKIFIIKETTVPVQHCKTVLLVLVDHADNKGYYLDIQKKLSISIYAYGCRMLRKVFKTSQPQQHR